MKNVFRYPGGKSLLSSWIIEHFPDHHCYVEVFGGSAAVMVNKTKSDVEVFNDADGDIVHFFNTLRNKPEELTEWLATVPFSRDLHTEWAHEFYDGHRPSDDVERAGKFFYLRETQFAQKYTGVSGFRASKEKNSAREFHTKAGKMMDFAERFHHVQIENLDYEELMDRYDSDSTLFYCDPPYVDEGDDLYSHDGGFDHPRFVEALERMDGKWIVSYTDLPEGLQSGYFVKEKDKRVSMRSGQDDGEWAKMSTERLVMNFDPRQTPAFHSADQASLADGGWAEESR